MYSRTLEKAIATQIKVRALILKRMQCRIYCCDFIINVNSVILLQYVINVKKEKKVFEY